MMKQTFVWVGAALMLATCTYAQTNQKSTDTVPANLLDEVVVTANKLAQKQSQTGKVVSVISKEQLEKSNGRTLGQLLNEQAGITIPGALNNLGSPQTLSVRGAGSGRTLVLVDGVPAFDPSLINSEFDLNLISLNDVERIEIARGAQSTLYGSDAVGGVVNIITTKNQVNKPINVKATASYGNLHTLRGQFQLYGRTGKLSYTAQYARLQSDGFSAAYDSTGNKGFDKDGYTGNNFKASVQYAFNSQWTAQAYVQRNLYKADVDGGVFTDDKDFTIDNKNTMAGGVLTYKSAKMSLTANYQYSDIRRNYLNDSNDVSGFASYVTDDYFGRNQFADVYANINLGKGFSLLAGTDYRFSSMHSQYFSLSSFGPFTSNFSDTSVNQIAVYASLIAEKKRWNIEIGGRINRHEQYGTNATYTFNPSFRIDKNLRIFGSIASAFKAPSLYQLYASFGNPNLKAEEATTYELGLQHQYRKKLTNRVVFFHRNIKNGIDFDNIQFSYFNINAQTVTGLELESQLITGNKLTISGNYTLLLAEENIQSRNTAKDTTYNYLLRRPKHNVNLTVSYQITPKWMASVTGKYVSKRYDAGGFRRSDVALDGYFLLGAYTEYRFSEKFRLFADGQNLLNEKFFDIRGYNAIPLLINGGFTLTL